MRSCGEPTPAAEVEVWPQLLRQSRPDFFQELGRGLARVQRGKFAPQFHHGQAGARSPEVLLRSRRPRQGRAQDHQAGPGRANQDQRVVQAAIGVDVVSRTVQQLPQVSQHVSGLIDAQYMRTFEGDLFSHGTSPVKRRNRLRLGFVRVEQRDQVCHLQDFADVLRHIAQLQVAAGSAGAGQQPHQSSQSTAVDEDHFAQVQDKAFAILQEFADVKPQEFRLTAGHDASSAPDNGDVSHSARVQR